MIFPAQDGLQPGQSFTYTIEALGLQVGDARFRAELTTSTLPTPVAKEESTTIYDPASGPPKPAQPPAGAGAPTVRAASADPAAMNARIGWWRAWIADYFPRSISEGLLMPGTKSPPVASGEQWPALWIAAPPKLPVYC